MYHMLQQQHILAALVLMCLLSSIVLVQGSPNLISFRSKNLFPGGLEYSPSVGFIVGAQNGNLYKISDQGEISPYITDSRMTGLSSGGLHIDKQRNILLATVSNSTAAFRNIAEYSSCSLLKINLATGKIDSYISLDHVRLNSFKGAMLAGDATYDNNGNIYVTESMGGSIWKIDTNNNVTIYTSNTNWIPEKEFTPGVGGVVYHKNGYLLVGKQGVGSVFKVILGPIPQVTEVTWPDTVRPAGIKGIMLNDENNLLVVGYKDDQVVYEIESEDDWSSARIIRTVKIKLSEPTSIARRGDDYYVVHSYLTQYFAGRDTYEISKIPEPISKSAASATAKCTFAIACLVTLMSLVVSLLL